VKRTGPLVWLCVLALALAAYAAVRIAEARALAEEGWAALRSGEAQHAEELLARAGRWAWQRDRVTSGLLLARAAQGKAVAAGPLSVVAASPSFADELSRQMERAWAGRRAAAVRSLASLAEGGGHPLAPVYEAALALDAGDETRARACLGTAGAAAASVLGREVAQVLALRAHGARTLVRDRRGRAIGHVNEAGAFVVADGVDPAWVPAAAAALVTALPGGVPRAVRLTLDLDLLQLAQAALAGQRGSIVLLEPRSSAVLAAVSDEETTARAAGGTPAFEDRREPASISKVITTAAALRAGLDPDAEIAQMTCTGSAHYGSGVLWCPHPAGRLRGLDEAMAWSCNIAFANLGVRLGRQRMLDELHRWGFDRDDLGLAPPGRVVQPEGDDRQLADMSIGLEATDITPLHAALLATVLGDQGHMPEPYLVDAEESLLGLTSRPRPHPAPRKVIEPEWVGVLSRAMSAVSTDGTARGIAPPDFPVVMKTGVGATFRLGYHANYMGVGPWPRPTIAFCVRITHEPTSERARRAARQVLGTLLRALADRRERDLRTQSG
jgi:penicillin-binding protein A